MATKQQQDFPPVQAAIYGVALSMDAFLLNGIQYGVLPQGGVQPGTVPDGFLRKTASNLLRDLESLGKYAPEVAVSDQPKVRELLAALQGRCQQLIDVVIELSSFGTLSPTLLRSKVAQIPRLREECVQLIQELEGCLLTPKPFYQSRPDHSTVAVNNYLADLERIFAEELAGSSGVR
jgi:hypothetical protein